MHTQGFGHSRTLAKGAWMEALIALAADGTAGQAPDPKEPGSLDRLPAAALQQVQRDTAFPHQYAPAACCPAVHRLEPSCRAATRAHARRQIHDLIASLVCCWQRADALWPGSKDICSPDARHVNA